ncbi:MAG: NAD(P)H-hydrate dehydratase [Persicimonas sp.]
MKLVTPDQMREMDRQTIEDIGVPGIVLMERAALGAVQALLEYLPEGAIGQIGFLCGGGNNGGDGLAMARIVAEDGYQPVVALLGDADSLRGEAAKNLEIVRNLDIPVVELGDAEPDEVGDRLAELGYCLAWSDALLGTGLDREVEGRYAAGVEFLNRQPFVFSVDIPSGINGSTGRVMGTAVEADATATFGEVKLGQALYPGRSHCGDLHVVDIGIPPHISEDVGDGGELLDEDWAFCRMSARPPDYHKGKSGELLIVAGSHEKTGAALLCARGALASGAGLVTVGTHAQVIPRVATTINEAMAAEMLSHTFDEHCQERLREFLPGLDAVAMGPGMGTSDGARQALEAVLASDVPAAVFDADALTILAGQDDFTELRAFAESSEAVLTPHPGEMARLCGCEIAEVLSDPVGLAEGLAKQTGAIVVLKMAATVVAGPDGQLGINSNGNPGMATGGVGDVLTGVIGARLAEGTEPAFDAVCLAVYAHGAAGDAAARDHGERGMGAVDLSEALGAVWKRLEA